MLQYVERGREADSSDPGDGVRGDTKCYSMCREGERPTAATQVTG